VELLPNRPHQAIKINAMSERPAIRCGIDHERARNEQGRPDGVRRDAPAESGTRYGPAFTELEKLEKHFPRSGMQESLLHMGPGERSRDAPPRVRSCEVQRQWQPTAGPYPRIDVPIMQHHSTTVKGLARVDHDGARSGHRGL
jgi:hypothetical protein